MAKHEYEKNKKEKMENTKSSPNTPKNIAAITPAPITHNSKKIIINIFKASINLGCFLTFLPFFPFLLFLFTSSVFIFLVLSFSPCFVVFFLGVAFFLLFCVLYIFVFPQLFFLFLSFSFSLKNSLRF